ncbi:transposase [Streptosporangium sp. G11]|uniref:transposase n=1 Tax=Streptosporangium sp. G11 TaxID=3436926 RepID=UPI003EBF06D2
MGETRRRFDPEFRAGAVRIVRETRKPIAQVAKDLGINAGTLANWVQMDRLAREQDTNGGELAESEREEFARLGRLPGPLRCRDPPPLGPGDVRVHLLPACPARRSGPATAGPAHPGRRRQRREESP